MDSSSRGSATLKWPTLLLGAPCLICLIAVLRGVKVPAISGNALLRLNCHASVPWKRQYVVFFKLTLAFSKARLNIFRYLSSVPPYSNASSLYVVCDITSYYKANRMVRFFRHSIVLSTAFKCGPKIRRSMTLH